MGNHLLQVYSRIGCHLCELMCAQLDRLKSSLPFDYDVIDVDSDIELKKRYGLLVPVLVSKGKILCHYHLDETALRQFLDKNCAN